VPTFLEIMWAVIGLLLTIGTTFLQAYVLVPSGSGDIMSLQQINSSFQIGAVLLTGCLGGKNAGLLAQVAYIFLGLSGFGVFYQGGGITYLRSPAFGYILGFIPGAWLCGWLALQQKPSISRLVVSCLAGLLVIHLVGIIYLLILGFRDPALIQATLTQYSFQRLPGQLLVICATVTISFCIRLLLLY
jgi:biotin transport system substrate-specific component